jgi:hypothetical protein
VIIPILRILLSKMVDVKITKRQFDKAYNAHLPSGWIKFAFKYFSKQTEKENMSLRNHLVFFLLGLFLLGFFGTVLEASRAFIGIPTLIYGVVLAVLVFYLLSAVLLNNFRLRKVRKVLGISRAQYMVLVRKYYP